MDGEGWMKVDVVEGQEEREGRMKKKSPPTTLGMMEIVRGKVSSKTERMVRDKEVLEEIAKEDEIENENENGNKNNNKNENGDNLTLDRPTKNPLLSPHSSR